MQTMRELVDSLGDHIKESCVECAYDHNVVVNELLRRIATYEKLREAGDALRQTDPLDAAHYHWRMKELSKCIGAIDWPRDHR